MRKSLKVLHIASFKGNIGDNANHIGSKYLREKYLEFNFEITEKEIRTFYWGEWRFNSDEFVQEANEFDLIMIGGGNYFELWVKDSETGTSIDIGLDYLEKIKTPILFYSLGCDLGQGVPKENISKFKLFLDYLTDDSRYFVSVRNDGALDNIKTLYGTRYDDKIYEIPDGGFFTFVNNLDHFEIDKNKKNIIINIAGDMSEIRFPNVIGNISYESFVYNFAKILNELCTEYKNNINFIFVPHIFRDLKMIYEVINKLDDKVRRSNVKVAPYLIGAKGHNYIFSLYNQSDLILAMRFHSNVCGYALKKNVIGLINYIQIENLYRSLDSNEYVEVNKGNFETELKNKVVAHLNNPKKYEVLSEEIISNMMNKAQGEYIRLNEWLKINFGGK